MIRQVLGKENMNRTRVFEWHALFRADRERRDKHAHRFPSSTSRGLFTNNSSGKAKQSIPHSCDVLRRQHEIVRRLRPELWRQKNWLLHHYNAPSHTSFFTRELWARNNVTVVPPPSLLFSVSPIEDKTERPPFLNN
jgi:hypothetical protein